MDKVPNYYRIQSLFTNMIDDLNYTYDILKRCISSYGKDNEKILFEYCDYLDDVYVKIKTDCNKLIEKSEERFMVAPDDFYNTKWKEFRSLLKNEYIYYEDAWYKIFSRNHNLHNDLRELIFYEPLEVAGFAGLGYMGVDTFAKYFDKIKVIKLYEFAKIDIVEKYNYWRKKNKYKITINKFKTYKKLKK